MIEYCAGFFFDQSQERVWLIRKQRPDWRAGKLNAIGGKVERGELAGQAMRREFLEEAGVDISVPRWRLILCLTEQALGWCVSFFAAIASDGEFERVHTVTDEWLESWRLADLWQRTDILPGLRYQMALALDNSGLVLPLLLEDRGIGARR